MANDFNDLVQLFNVNDAEVASVINQLQVEDVNMPPAPNQGPNQGPAAVLNLGQPANVDVARLQAELKECKQQQAAQARDLVQLQQEKKQWEQEKKGFVEQIMRLSDASSDATLNRLRANASTNAMFVKLLNQFNDDLKRENERWKKLASDRFTTAAQQFAVASQNMQGRPNDAVTAELQKMREAIQLMRDEIAGIDIVFQNAEKYQSQMLKQVQEERIYHEWYEAGKLYADALKNIVRIQGGHRSVVSLDELKTALFEEKRKRIIAVLEHNRDKNELERTIEMLRGQLGTSEYKQPVPEAKANAAEEKNGAPVIAPPPAEQKIPAASAIPINTESMTASISKIDLSRAKEYLQELRAMMLAKEKEIKGFQTLSLYNRAQLEIQSQEILRLKEQVDKLDKAQTLEADLKRLRVSPFADLDLLKETARVARSIASRYTKERSLMLVQLEEKIPEAETDVWKPIPEGKQETKEAMLEYIDYMRKTITNLDGQISALKIKALQNSDKSKLEKFLGLFFAADSKKLDEFNNKCEEEKKKLQAQIDTLLLLVWGSPTEAGVEMALSQFPLELRNKYLNRNFNAADARVNILLGNLNLLNREIAGLREQLRQRPGQEQKEPIMGIFNPPAFVDVEQKDFVVAPNQAAIILTRVQEELRLLWDEEKETRPVSGLPPVYEDGLDFETWDRGPARVFNRLLQRARDIRSMKLVPPGTDMDALPFQLDRLGITVDVLSDLFATVNQKDPGKKFNAQKILDTWRANQRIPIELQESMSVAIGAQLSIWRSFYRLMQAILAQFRQIGAAIPEFKAVDADEEKLLNLEGNFTVALNNAAAWAQLEPEARVNQIKGLAKMLGDTPFADTFNAQFDAWTKAASTVFRYMDPSRIRPDGTLDLKIQEAVNAIGANYQEAISRLVKELERLQVKHTKDITEDILTRMTNAGADLLWNVREEEEKKNYVLDAAMVDGMLMNLLRQLRPDRIIVPESLFAEQQRRFQAKRDLEEMKRSMDELKTEKKELEEKETKARAFLTSLLTLMLKNPEDADEIEVRGVIPRPLPNVQIDFQNGAPIDDLIMQAVKTFFTDIFRRFAVTHKALLALRDKLGDLTLRQTVQKLLRAKSLTDDGIQDLLNSLALVQARVPGIGVGTAGFQRPLANLELDVVGDSGMTSWALFHGRPTFGSIYGFARVVAGFLNRAEDTMMVQLVPGVESGSTVFWLIMGRIEDEIRMNEARDPDEVERDIDEQEIVANRLEDDLKQVGPNAAPEVVQNLESVIDETRQRKTDLQRVLRHRGITTNKSHFDIHAIEEKVAALLPEQRENMKKELLERRDLQMRVAIESLRRLYDKSRGREDEFTKEALSFYKPQLVSAILLCYELLRRIPEMSVAPLFELMSVDRVATRFAALVANSIKAIELQTDSKTFDQTLFRTLNNEQRTIVSEFQYMLKRKGAHNWDVIIQKRERWDS